MLASMAEREKNRRNASMKNEEFAYFKNKLYLCPLKKNTKTINTYESKGLSIHG